MGGREAAVVIAAVIALALTTARYSEPMRNAAIHPLHTTLTEVSVDAAGAVDIRLRAFVDDFWVAVGGRRDTSPLPYTAPKDSAAARYLSSRLMLMMPGGRAATLRVTSVRHEGDVVWVTLRAVGVRSVAGARLTNTVLFERYDDQVNIVQTDDGARRRTVLFTTRDGRASKPLAG
jgi:hypothetical protein